MRSSTPEIPWLSSAVSFDPRSSITDGLQVVFFLKDSHRDCVPALKLVLEVLSATLGPDTFGLYVDEEGYTKPFSEAWLASLLNRMRTEPLGEVTLSDAKDQVGSFEFSYFARELPYARWPGYRNLLWFYLPRQLVADKGIHAIRELILRGASALPFSFAYAQPALAYHPADEFIARRLTLRFPGYELLDPTYCRLELDDQVCGVYWLSMLGEALTHKLGGVEALRARVPPEIRVEPLAPSGTLVQIGQQPSVGDVNREDSLPLYRALAQVFKPHLYIPRAPYLVGEEGLPDQEGTLRWHLRFFETPPHPTP